jgi:hypothetical protein
MLIPLYKFLKRKEVIYEIKQYKYYNNNNNNNNVTCY